MQTNNAYQKTVKTKPVKSTYKPLSKHPNGKTWERQNKEFVRLPNRY